VFSCAYAEVERWELDAIPLENFSRIKNNKGHVIYKGDGCYVKIWHQGSWHFRNKKNDLFAEAVEQGFFDEIAPLKALIMDKDKCCGYVTWACQPLHVDSSMIKKKLISLDRIRHPEMILVMQLYAQMRKQVLATGFCLTQDFSAKSNLALGNERCYLIDLDHIEKLENFKKQNPKTWKSKLYFLYEQFAYWEK
jgi:hypothetical protein